MEISDGDSSDVEKINVHDKYIDESLVESSGVSKWKLRANKLEIYRMQDANRAAYSQVIYFFILHAQYNNIYYN